MSPAGRRQQGSTPPISARDLEKLLLAWGWAQTSSGTKHARWRKGTTTITVRRPGSSRATPTWEPVRGAAKVEGITPELWLKGPPPNANTQRVANTGQLAQEDLDYYVNPRTNILEPRFAEIERAMKRQGVLGDWRKARQAARTQHKELVMSSGAPKPATAPEPLPVKVSDDGYITLDAALELVNLKQNQLSMTSCWIIAALSESESHDDSGRATAKLRERLPDPSKIGMSALSSRLKAWETAGLIWREQNGKRTYKIGLSLAVRLTKEEAEKYLRALKMTAAGVKEVVQSHPAVQEVIKKTVLPKPEPEPVTTVSPPAVSWSSGSVETAIAVLLAERNKLQAQVDSLDFAIELLTNKENG